MEKILSNVQEYIVVAFKNAVRQNNPLKPIETIDALTYKIDAQTLDTSKIQIPSEANMCEIWCELAVKTADGMTLVSDPIEKRTLDTKHYKDSDKISPLDHVKNEVKKVKIPYIIAQENQIHEQCYIGYSTVASEEFVKSYERVEKVPNLGLENVKLQNGGLKKDIPECRFEIFSRYETRVKGSLDYYTLHSPNFGRKTYFVGYELPDSNSLISISTADGQKVKFMNGSAAFTTPDNIDGFGKIIDLSKVGPEFREEYGLL